MAPAPSALSWTVAYPTRRYASEHEVASQRHVARQVSILLGCPLLEPFRPSRRRTEHGSCYYVPDRTLIGHWRAGTLGLRAASQLFGGIVPHSFVATKVVSHGLWAADSEAPAGWAHGLAPRLQGSVLSGYSAFSRKDALQAGQALLRDGPIRLKAAAACAGRGQYVVEDAAGLEAALDDAARDGGLASGIVLEENLQEVETFSVGWCHVGDHALAYVGTQELTRDHQGQPVYGGSMLRCVRGGPERLASLDLPAGQARAVELAVAYDAAVSSAYPGLHASRRNYDVAAGRNAGGQARIGVLEQSWRMGGASLAEMAAMLHFSRDSGQDEVWAYSKERYGADASEPPAGDCVFRGEDSQVGFMTKAGGILEKRGCDYGGT